MPNTATLICSLCRKALVFQKFQKSFVNSSFLIMTIYINDNSCTDDWAGDTLKEYNSSSNGIDTVVVNKLIRYSRIHILFCARKQNVFLNRKRWWCSISDYNMIYFTCFSAKQATLIISAHLICLRFEVMNKPHDFY